MNTWIAVVILMVLSIPIHSNTLPKGNLLVDANHGEQQLTRFLDDRPQLIPFVKQGNSLLDMANKWFWKRSRRY